MKKVLLTSMILLSAVSFGGNVYAQGTAGGNDTKVTTPSTTQPSVKFTADGNTLTISGQGDLTSYMTTDYSAKVFTDKAVGSVFTDDKGTKVNAKDSYNSGKTYYQAEYEYTQIFDGGLPIQYTYGFGAVNTVFDETKISNLYSGYLDNGNIKIEKKVQASDTPNILGKVTWTYEGKEYYNYFTCDEELPNGTTIALTDLETSKVGLLDKAGLYEHLKVTYQVFDGKSLFVKHAGSDEKTALVANTTYTYQSGDLFYEGTATYAVIENNDAFFTKNADYLAKDESEISFKDLLLRKMAEKEYEKVVFVNDSEDKLLINNEIIKNILYNQKVESWGGTKISFNDKLTSVDFGAAVCTDFSADTFNPGSISGNSALVEITLPQSSDNIIPTKLLSDYWNQNTVLKTINVPEGYTKVAESAFYGMAHLQNVSLPNTLQEIGDRAFQGCTYLQKVNLLNVNLEDEDSKEIALKEIGSYAFYGATNLSELIFPASLRTVKDGAFVNLPNIKNIKLNAGIEYIGNGAFGLTSEVTEQTVIEMPASLKYLGPGSFVGRKFQDVYFLGVDAPISPLGAGITELGGAYNDPKNPITAFMGSMHMGNNGFDPGNNKDAGKLADKVDDGYANRENYICGKTYFTILHYPKGLANSAAEKYTDITRVYDTWKYDDGTFHRANLKQVGDEKEVLKFNGTQLNGGNVNSIGQVDPGYEDTYLGSQYIWPAQNQWMRSYVCNSLGLKWDGVTTYPLDTEDILTDEQVQLLRDAGYSEEDYPTEKDLAKIAYLGTRQFTIANGDANADDKPDEEPEYKIDLKPGQWWTLCVPFNMTKKQVLETFGSDTQLYFFYEVDRHTTNGKNSILLKFTKDALNNSSTDGEGKKMKGEDGKWEYDQMESGTDNDEVVIWAHESYMIKPMKGVNSDKEPTFVVKNYAPVVGNPLPTVVKAKGDDQLQDDDYSKEYRFIGNYLGSTDNNKVVIPQYSYVYGKTAKDPTYKFRFYTGKTSVWKPNKSLVQSHDRQGGLLDYNNFFGADKQSAKQASIFGEENFGETTGIDDVTIIAGNEVLTPIFTLDGKMVSANGSVDGLAKGVYVKAGKKFVVK